MSRGTEEEAPATDLYEKDFHSWTRQQADILRSGRMDGLDVANILEEIETLGRAERSSLKSSYRLICSHLLKMKYQTRNFTRSWYNTVDRERGEIVDLLEENPSLRPERHASFAKAYKSGRRDAARETRLPLETFPESPPFTLSECESTAYLPRELLDWLATEDPATGRTIATRD